MLPTAFRGGSDGPDAGGTLYLHGSVAADWLEVRRSRRVSAVTGSGCGARSPSPFDELQERGGHRQARIVGDEAELLRALELTISDHMIWALANPASVNTQKACGNGCSGGPETLLLPGVDETASGGTGR